MKKHKKVRTKHISRRSSQPKWIKRFIAFFAVLVLVAGFGAVCIYFAHQSSAVLGAHIVIAH